ncbi:MAG: hypothetical protein ACOYI6_08725 [Christensenellales bacterium]|jgi:hypothetical protein|nr:hypothetical protein [Chloroflexota bacterium]
MRNLGIKAALFSTISQPLSMFPRYQNKEINGYTILCAYAKYLECMKPPIRKFASRFESSFGAQPNQMKAETLALKAQFDRPDFLPNLIRFGMPDVVGDVQGVMGILSDQGVEDAVYLFAQAIAAKDPEAAEEELIEEEPEQLDGPEEDFSTLETSVKNIIIRHADFIRSDSYDGTVAELVSLFPESDIRIDHVLKTYRASTAHFRPTRLISEKLFDEIRRIDSLELYDILSDKARHVDIKLEVGVLYEFITSPLDLHEPGNHLLFVNPSIHLLSKWLRDDALSSVRATFVFSSQEICNFARVSMLLRERKNLVTVSELEVWSSFIQSEESARFPKITVAYVNIADEKWSKVERRSEFNSLLKPQMAENALVYYFCSPKYDEHSALRKRLQFDSKLRLTTFAVLMGLPLGHQNQHRVVACYSLGKAPALEQNLSEMPLVYNVYSQQDDILTMQDNQFSQSANYELSELPSGLVDGDKQEPAADKHSYVPQTNVEIIEFSPEIDFKMRKIYENGKFKRVCASCNGPPVPRTRNRGIKTKTIEGSELYKSQRDIEVARNWVKLEYPFLVATQGSIKRQLKKSSDKSSTIRELVSAEYANKLLNEKTSLRGFYYTNQKVEKTLSNRKIKLLRAIMMSDIGLFRLEECSTELLTDAVIKDAENLAPEDVTERLGLVHIVLKHALKLKCIKENQMDSWASTVEKIKDRRKHSREALGKNSLSLSQLKAVYSVLSKNVEEPRYLGLMIQMLTGLSANEVCGLTLGSVDSSLKLVPVTLLKITQESMKDGKLIPFDDLYKYRWIPCANLLARRIDEQCGRLTNKKRLTKAMAETRLLSYPGASKDELPKSFVLPQEIRELSRKILKRIGINPHYILLSDEGLKTKRTNINLYYGEMLKSNFEYYTRRVMGFSSGEYAYLVGNVQSLVKDKNYIDYSNVHSQLRMHRKMERWRRYVVGKVSIKNKRAVYKER